METTQSEVESRGAAHLKSEAKGRHPTIDVSYLVSCEFVAVNLLMSGTQIFKLVYF
jgi:hypothetical protein